MADLKNLRYQNLSGPSFSGRIHPHHGNLSNLQYHDLSSGPTIWLSSLRHLDMSWVDLSAVKDWVHTINTLSSSKDHKGIKELYLTDGHWFRSIPDALGNMSALQVMHLGHNKLTETMPTTLEHLCDLQVVSLYDNYIDGDATEFMETFME
uniref:Leucine-rich repeat-containing N-terminal plant-type domain-containing protein n=1 Tax=Oryza punctata TaxID=4537 RepID=A0A0E0LKD8_ORYPU